MSRYHYSLIAIFAAVWAWAAWEPLFRAGWLLENCLVFIFVPVIIGLGYYFRLSNLSYTLITLFMILHVAGSHYTYEHVPFGYTLQQWFGTARNPYDRLVHFSFGLLLAYPMREMFLRVARVRGVWGYYLPLDVVLAFSGLFEIFEWVAAVNSDPQAGLAFLGAQGDIWDAQKDMLLAGFGALITMAVTAALNWWLDPEFGRDMKLSFRTPRQDGPLGEVELWALWKKKFPPQVVQPQTNADER